MYSSPLLCSPPLRVLTEKMAPAHACSGSVVAPCCNAGPLVNTTNPSASLMARIRNAGPSVEHHCNSAVKQRGREGTPGNHPENSSQKVADFECRFPYDSYGKSRAPLWPFLGEGFWGSIRRPLLLPAPLFCC